MTYLRQRHRRGYMNPRREGQIYRRESAWAWTERMVQRDGIERSEAFKQGMMVAHAGRYMAEPLGRYGRPAVNSPEFAEFQAGYSLAEELLSRRL